MENLVIKGRITATSKKQDDKFKQENPSKTAWIIPADEQEAKKLVDFGLRQYTSKEDGTNFFVVKTSQRIALYVKDAKDVEPEIISGGIDTPNFTTAEDKFLNLNIIKGENVGNKFYRLQAIQIVETSDYIEVEQNNPFE